MTEEQTVIPSRGPPPLPPNHPSTRKPINIRPPPPKPPQYASNPSTTTSKQAKQTNINKDITIISAQPLTQSHPYYLVTRPTGENSDDTSLPPKSKPPPITSKPIPPKPQNYVNLEISDSSENDISPPNRPNQPPVTAKTDDRPPIRPTSPPSDIFLSNILEKEAIEKPVNKPVPTRQPPPPRPVKTPELTETDSADQPPSQPPGTTRKLSMRKAPPPPGPKAVYPSDLETQNQVEVTKTAESTEPTANIRSSPRRPAAPQVKRIPSPLTVPSLIKHVSAPPKLYAPLKPTRPGNPKPVKPNALPIKQRSLDEYPRKTPSLPPRPEPGHPLYKYVCSEPHGFAKVHYPTNQPDMLSISKGEFLILLERLDANWYYCANEGDGEGLVLVSNIQVVRKLPDEGGQIISADKPFAVAMHDYNSVVDGDLNFKKGDVIFLVRYLSDTWIEGECEKSHAVGMFPKAQVEIVTDLEEGPPAIEDIMVGPRAKVIFDFPGDQSGDLPLIKDSFVYLLEKLDGGWYKGALAVGNTEGIFPEGFIEVIEPLPEKAPVKEPVPEKVPVKEPENAGPTGYTGTAIYEFLGGTAGDLSFNIGDVIHNITSVNDEWLQGELNGVKGIFPVGFIEEKTAPQIKDISPVKTTPKTSLFHDEFLPRAKALYDYNENVSGDLCFKAGDMICLLQKLNAEWFEGELNGVVGNLPAAFVEVIVPLP